KVTVAQGATLSEAQASAAVAKVNGSPDLPAGTTYEWVDAHGNKITPTASTAGVQTFKVKVTLPPAQSGNDAPEATKRQPYKIIDVPVNVAPSAPTITTETRYNGTLVSTDRRISGTGIAGAKVTVTLQDGKTGTTTVDNNGRWTYNLKDNEKLTQNTKQDASIKAPNAISVTQTKDGVESPASRVDVQLAKAISIDTPVQAGRELAVKVAHDTGLFYLQVLNGNQTVYEYAVKQQNGNWVLEKGSDTTDLTVSNGDNVSEKKITLRIKDSHKKTNFPFKITGDNVVRVRAHHVNGKNNPADPANDGGWVVAAKATNTNPTITINNPRATYVADGTLTKDKLKTLVTVTDPEDDADKTVGSRAKDNLDVTATKDGKNVDLAQPLKQGTYNLTYRTTDAAGASVTKEHTITVNYTAVAKPTINLLQGETVSDELKRSLVQLRDGNDVIDVPRDARVEVAVDTSSKTNQNKQAQATVVLADGTRLAPVTLSYRVLPTFPIARTVYDFKNVSRSDDESKYYLNTGIPGGMKWFAKRGNEAEIDASGLRDKINADPVGETTYKFGGKYNYGRFTDSPQPADKLEHAATFTHKVFDIKPND
ncbi:MAG: Ig-like domain-containing protein, partial [Streptococcus mitis]|nr:Ig-like domain-containing protein [Streptococcus mitis]